MLHAPTTEVKTETAQSKSQLAPLSKQQCPSFLHSTEGQHMLSDGIGNAKSNHAPYALQHQTFAGMQSAYGNQAVLHTLYTSPQVARMIPLRPSQGVVLQRKCACGGSSESTGECAECNANAAPVGAQGVPSIIHDVLHSPGQPVDAGTRAFMEPRFGHDFSQVRVHTDAKAAESARAVNALAYTVGRDVVFGAGQHQPETSEGRRLIAHELTHVLQQSTQMLQMPTEIDRGPADPLERTADNVAEHITADRQSLSDSLNIPDVANGYATSSLSLSHPMIQRQVNMSVAEGTQTIPASNPERQARLEQLLNQINTQTAENLSLRNELDALSPASSEERTSLETEINSRRSVLIPLLEQRIALLDEEIAALKAGAGPTPVSSPEHPEAETFGSELTRREGERRQHEQQLRPLKRWQMQNDINTINEQIAEVEHALANLPPESTPTTDNLFLRHAELERQKKEIAVALTSTATEYKQFDIRWGATRYGPSSNCTNVQEAGCGPTSLAIMLNYLYQEDPESIAASGSMEIVTPQETVPYATTHGRICPDPVTKKGGGTVGDTMVTQVHTGWPGYQGRKITLVEASTQLRSGNLVMFLCKDCIGKNRSGGDKHYGGHFMVLNGVNDDSTTFNVLDPGANEAKDIETISQEELKIHAKGFWIVERM